MAGILKGFHSFTSTPTRSSTIRMSHTCLCLPSWYSIYWPWRDGRLSRPWCEVAAAEIQACNLQIASPALYHTATSAPTHLTLPTVLSIYCVVVNQSISLLYLCILHNSLNCLHSWFF